ncbi:hypothetical protein AYI68_g8208 [Smittium mucronatum]|uniref:Zn(2)-C6 fungal-type domain-containing protein n=1 Tax=Smittium mucronatum TaxID=133383 RepID=A0A1R0GLI8_9FUNG|nr:hypothetical protein AYI68_g8208 [Smittium mucronatum]
MKVKKENITSNDSDMKKLAILSTCICCQKRKVKCDGVKPSCFNCVRRGDVCQYRRSVRYRTAPQKQAPKNLMHRVPHSPNIVVERFYPSSPEYLSIARQSSEPFSSQNFIVRNKHISATSYDRVYSKSPINLQDSFTPPSNLSNILNSPLINCNLYDYSPHSGTPPNPSIPKDSGFSRVPVSFLLD